MARMTVVVNSILPCQEAFLVDAPTPNTSPHRWIQAKPESTDGFVGSSVWGRVAAGLVRVCGLARFGAFWGVRDWSAGLVRLVAGGVGLRCAGRCGRFR